MEPVSRDSYTAAVERLETLVTGERPVPLAGVADEILGVARLLAGQPRLRRTLSDPARTGTDRAELLGSLLDGKVTEDTAALIRLVVAGRWSSSSELLNAIERLGVEALLASADSAGELADVEDELFRFGKLIDANPELAAEMGNTSVPASRRAHLVRSLLEGKATPATIRLAELALEGFGGRNVAGSLSRLVELAAARRDRQIAYVTVAAALSHDEERRLAERLGQIYHRQIDIKLSVEPRVLGGVSVRIGHDLYDGTVLRRINHARAALAAGH